jgi:RimJ/RimL family protein N-acetyltransferase
MFELRRFRPDDDAELTALFADPATRLWNPGPADGGVAAWRESIDAPSDEHRTWAVDDPAAGGRLVGVVSVFAVDREQRRAEIGFRTVPAARGRGVAAAAAAAACARIAAEGLVDRIELFHAVENVASCRVAQAAGFALVATVPANYRYGDGELHDEHLHRRDLTR